MSSFLEKRENDLKQNKKIIKKGINIDTLIHTQNYHNSIIKTNMNMFSQYLDTFNHHHTSYFNSLLNRSSRINDDIDKNIKTTTPSVTPETSPSAKNCSECDNDTTKM
jgi:hypothetical protein